MHQIATVIGRPIRIDLATKATKKGKFARLLEWMELNCKRKQTHNNGNSPTAGPTAETLVIGETAKNSNNFELEKNLTGVNVIPQLVPSNNIPINEENIVHDWAGNVNLHVAQDSAKGKGPFAAAKGKGISSGFNPSKSTSKAHSKKESISSSYQAKAQTPLDKNTLATKSVSQNERDSHIFVNKYKRKRLSSPVASMLDVLASNLPVLGAKQVVPSHETSEISGLSSGPSTSSVPPKQ
ncbi:hypothetical protein PIB30_077875 [Stylosanthes scabra]|uniref:Uncharacterized protein n=1 Tax=Stylosanthes scabra TaxID=79078 RepID=A0ABU6WQJ4_9FABA|nr:hypothetical protein [Stylosanthes scabra]